MRMTLLSSLFFLALGLVLAPSGVFGQSDRLTDPEPRVRQYFTVCLNSPDLECLARYWPASKVEAVRKSETFRRHYFPDLRYAVREVIVQGDRVVVIARITGHPRGDSDGALDLEEVYLYTFLEGPQGGRFTQGEIFSDRLAVSQALGYRVVPPEDGP